MCRAVTPFKKTLRELKQGRGRFLGKLEKEEESCLNSNPPYKEECSDIEPWV